MPRSGKWWCAFATKPSAATWSRIPPRHRFLLAIHRPRLARMAASKTAAGTVSRDGSFGFRGLVPLGVGFAGRAEALTREVISGRRPILRVGRWSRPSLLRQREGVLHAGVVDR